MRDICFPIRRNPQPEDFDFVEDVRRDLESLRERCAMFSRILWWKTLTLQTTYLASMLTHRRHGDPVVRNSHLTLATQACGAPPKRDQRRVAGASWSNRLSTSATMAPSMALISKSLGV